MSKISKKSNNNANHTTEENAYRTVLRSLILCIIFFILSILFNCRIINIFTSIDLPWIFFDTLIKVFIITLFFLFLMISIGNFKELTGKPLNMRDIVLIFIFSVIQGYTNPLVFFFSSLTLIIVLVYLYFTQE
jgi:hypothetical protein